MQLGYFHVLLTVVVSTLCVVSSASGTEIPARPQNLNTGIENGPWVAENWGNAGTAEMVGGDRKVLKLNFTAGEKEKTAFKRTERIDVSQNGGLTFQVYSPLDSAPSISVALCTTDAFIWHESKPVTLKKGWNALAFSTSSPDWKTEAAKWAFNAAVKPANDVRTLHLIVYNGKAGGELFVVGVRFELDIAASSGTAKKLPDLPPLKLSANAPKLEARGGWQASLDELEKRPDFIPRQWLLVGPLSDNNFKNFDLKDGLAPDRTDDWSALNTRRWTRPDDDATPLVDLEEILGQRNDTLAYAQTVVDASVAGPATFYFDCVGRAALSVNGEIVHRAHIKRRVSDVAADPLYPITVPLKAGPNVIKIKLGQEKHSPLRGFNFSLRILRNDPAYRAQIATELAQLYPAEAAGWRMAEWLLGTARGLERAGDTAAALKHYALAAEKCPAVEDARVEAAFARRRLTDPAEKDKKEDGWGKAEESFKQNLRKADVLAADAAMRDFAARFPFHPMAPHAVQFRGALRLDYGALFEAQPFFERSLREGGQDENVRHRALRALALAEFRRYDHADLPVNHDVQARLDGYRRSMQNANDDAVHAALKNLAEILSNNANALLKVSDSSAFPRYVGVREYIRSLLQSLPSESLAAYRAAAEARAKERVARAEQVGGIAELEAAAAEFPYTLSSARALNQLGNHHLDRGEHTQAAGKFQAIAEGRWNDAEAAELKLPTIRLKLAKALALDGQSESSRKELDQLEKSNGTLQFAGKATPAAEAVRRMKDRLQSAGAGTAAAAGIVQYQGGLARTGYSALDGTKPAGVLWQNNVFKSNSANRAKTYWPEDRLYTHTPQFPAVDGNRVYLTTLENAQAFDLQSGKELWNKSWNSSGTLLPDRFTSFPLNMPSVSNGKLFFRAQQDQRTTIRCLNAGDGGTLWTTKELKGFQDPVWLGDPAVAGDSVLALCAQPVVNNDDPSAQQMTSHALVSFDAASGQTRWICPLGTGLSGIRLRDNRGFRIIRTAFTLGAPAVHNGVVYTQTGLGSLAAVNAFTGEIVWLSAYPALRLATQDQGNSHVDGFQFRLLKLASRGPSSPVVTEKAVLVTPKDAVGLYAFERASGALLWQNPMEDSRFLVGATPYKVFTADNQLRAYSLDTGKDLWTYPETATKLELEGQPALAGNQILLPGKDALHIVDAQSGKAQTEKWDPKTGPLGNLVPLKGILLGLNERLFAAQKLSK